MERAMNTNFQLPEETFEDTETHRFRV